MFCELGLTKISNRVEFSGIFGDFRASVPESLHLFGKSDVVLRLLREMFLPICSLQSLDFACRLGGSRRELRANPSRVLRNELLSLFLEEERR